MIHATLLLAASGLAQAQVSGGAAGDGDTFTVGDIRVEGLQRISEGAVYNYLPVNIGDRLDRRRIAEAIQALYATGFFRDVELRRDGGTLIVAVQERPSIESFEIKGNKDIKTEDLKDSLKNVGLAAGKTFNQSTLDEVKQFLTDQYYSRGKYAVRIEAKVEDVPVNKVKVTVDITEGKRAKIRQINLVGNKSFKADDILDQFELKTPHLTSFYKQDDRYARETLQGDLEKLRSFYMDRGYANFTIDSTQVAIAPEKDDIFITVNFTEGDVFRISDVKLAGNLVVPEEELRKLIQIEPGTVYSRKLITQTQEAINQRLGVDGYAFAKVDPVPTVNNETHEISLTLLVDPGNRVYVHRVNFNGTTSINDEVLRREVRQLEGAYLSNALLDRSKQLLQRLPYIEKVEANTTPVPNTADLVDVDFKLKEGLPGQFSGGISYSESQRLGLNASITHTNFLGSGNRVSLEANSGRYSKLYSFSHTNPYATVDGISRTLSVAYRDTTQYTSSTSDFSTKTASAGVTYGYPISEYQSVRLGVTAQQAELLTSPSNSANEAVEWVRNNGKTYTRSSSYGTPSTTISWYGTKFNTYVLGTGWGYDSLNRALFADRGTRHRINLSYTVPGSDVDYWSASYDGLQLIPLWRSRFTLMFNANVTYAEALGGNGKTVPPYLNSYGGGPESVRGYQESRLGPKDSYGNPYGGNLRTILQTELLLPMPDKWKNSARFSFFYDIGNVFSTENISFVGRDKVTPVEYRFGFDKLKHSAGIAVQWLAPLGIFRFSYAVPLNASSGDTVRYPDEKEAFQFSIGNAF